MSAPPPGEDHEVRLARMLQATTANAQDKSVIMRSIALTLQVDALIVAGMARPDALLAVADEEFAGSTAKLQQAIDTGAARLRDFFPHGW